MLLLDGIPSPGQLIMPALTLAINLSFLLLFKFNQSNKQSFSKGKKSPTVMINEQCKEIEENNRMEMTGHLFKKIGETMGILHAKMGTIKDRNSKDLTDAEEIKKRCKNIKKNYTKKILMTQITTMM